MENSSQLPDLIRGRYYATKFTTDLDQEEVSPGKKVALPRLSINVNMEQL